jgi:hypothetical protein
MCKHAGQMRVLQDPAFACRSKSKHRATAHSSQADVTRDGERFPQCEAATIPARGESMSNLARGRAVKERAESGTDENRTVGRSSQSTNRIHWSTWNRSKTGSCTSRTETQNHVSSSAQTNRCSPARTLGEMEGGTTPQVSPIRPLFPQFHSQIFCFSAENCVDIDEATV